MAGQNKLVSPISESQPEVTVPLWTLIPEWRVATPGGIVGIVREVRYADSIRYIARELGETPVTGGSGWSDTPAGYDTPQHAADALGERAREMQWATQSSYSPAPQPA